MFELITKYILAATLLFSPTQMQVLGVFSLNEVVPSPQTVLEKSTPSSEPTPQTSNEVERVESPTPDSVLAQPTPSSESTSAPQSSITPEPVTSPTPKTIVVEPTISSEPTSSPLSSASPSPAQVKTSLTTIHKYTENNLPVEKEIVISDLVVGTTINTADYALTLENKVLDSSDQGELLLNELDNTVTYTYLNIATPELMMNELNTNSQDEVSSFANPTPDEIKDALVLSRDSYWVNETVAVFVFGVKANPINGTIYNYGTSNPIYGRINTTCFEMTNKPGETLSYETVGTGISTPQIDGDGSDLSTSTRVSWDVGTITDTEKILMIYVRPKTGCYGTVDTDSQTSGRPSTISYGSSISGQGISKEFPKSSIVISDKTSTGSIKVYNYLVNADGDMLDKDGNVTMDISKRVILSSALHKESGSEVLNFGTYTVTPQSMSGYIFEPNAANTISSPYEVTLDNNNTNKTLYYGYKEDVAPIKFSFTVEHYLEDENGNFNKDTARTESKEIAYVADTDILDADYVNASYATNYDFDTTQNSMINTDGTDSVLEVYYKRKMENVTYTVNHVVDGVTKASDSIVKQVWVGDTDKTVVVTTDSLTPKTGTDFTGYKQGTIKLADGTDVTADITKVPDGAIINITYVKDRFAFTVEYWLIDASGNFTKSAKNDGHTDIEHTAEYASTVKANDHILAIEDYVYWYAEQDEIEISEVSQENLLKLVYFKDVAGKIENGSDSADGIPDAYQTKFTYRATSGQGFVTSDNKTEIYEYVTKPYDASKPYDPAVKNSKVKPKATGVLAQADATYEFSNWSDETGLIYATIDDVKNAEFVDDMILTVNFRKKQDPTPLPTPTPTPTQTPAIDTPDEPIAPEPQPTVVPTARPVPTVRPKPSQTPTASPNTSPTPSEKTDGEANDEDKGEVTVVPTSPSNNNQGDKTPGSKDKVTESDSIFDDPTPFLGRLSSWALINLISMILGAIVTLVLLFAKRSKEEENEENKEMKDEYMRKRRYKVVGSLAAVIAVIMFCLTENMLLKMVWIDKYTPFMILFLIINLISFYFGRRWHEVEDKEEDKTKSA